MKYFSSCLLFLVIFGSVAKADSLPIVGVDKNGNEMSYLVSDSEYSETMGQIFSSVKSATLNSVKSQTPHTAWRLRDIAVGISMATTFGLGPVISLTAEPSFYLVFSNSIHPIHP